MSFKTVGWRTFAVELYLFSITVALIFLIRNIYKAYQAKEYNEAVPIRQQMLAAALVVVGVVGNNVNSLPTWVYVITPSCSHYALLVSYFVHYQVFNNKIIPIFTSKVFFVTSVLSIMTISIGLYAGDISVSIINEEQFQPGAFYYTYNALASLISLYLEVMNIEVIVSKIHQYSNITHIFRRYADLMLFSFFVVTSLSVELNVISGTLFDGLYRHEINNIFFAGIAGAGLFVPIVLMPQGLLVRLLGPLEKYHQQRMEEDRIYLYNKLTSVVRGVQYRPEHLRNKRMLIEMEQAHYILWTHEPKLKPIKPHDTTNVIFECLQQGTTYSQVGPCIPPPTKYDIDKHFSLVARQLRKLENKSRREIAQVTPAHESVRQRRESE